MALDSHIQDFINKYNGERVFDALKKLASDNPGYIFDARAIVWGANGETSRPQNGNILLTRDIVPFVLSLYVLDGRVLMSRMRFKPRHLWRCILEHPKHECLFKLHTLVRSGTSCF